MGAGGEEQIIKKRAARCETRVTSVRKRRMVTKQGRKNGLRRPTGRFSEVEKKKNQEAESHGTAGNSGGSGLRPELRKEEGTFGSSGRS